MDFKPISEFMSERGLKCPSLEILVQDHNLYQSLLCQTKGELEAGSEHIGNIDKDSVNCKLIDFFNLALKGNIDLAVTPEYSCPWKTMKSLIDEDILPPEKKLWVVGCESIKARELDELISKHEEIIWIYEENLLKEKLDSDNFFDPVCYLFKTRTIGEELENVALIQFKSHSMGSIDLERDNMIKGKTTYIIKNEQESSRLFTLICSDALNLTNGANLYDGFRNIPHLILHLQLNPKPNHPNIRPYRGNIYGMNWDDKEVICINWSRGTLMNGRKFNDYGGTAYYIQSSEVDLNDQRLDENFKLGLYYTYWDERYANIYYLNYDEHVFHLRSTKPSQLESPPPNRNRTGPEMLNVYGWVDGNWETLEEVDSGFERLCESLEDPEKDIDLEYLKSDQIGSTDIERLITLTTGNAEKKDWFDVKVNNYFKVSDEEKVRRITFPQTPCEEIRKSRKKSLNSYSFLKNTITKNSDYFPESLKDLRDNCIIKYRPDGFEDHLNYNLYPIDEKSSAPACGVFLGQNNQSEAERLLAKMGEKITSDQSGKRIIIWYRDGKGNLEKSYIGSKPKTTDNPTKSPRDIT